MMVKKKNDSKHYVSVDAMMASASLINEANHNSELEESTGLLLSTMWVVGAAICERLEAIHEELTKK